MNYRHKSDLVDLSTVIKLSQAIASEIVLENLLATLMKILLENSGAESGYLLLHTPKDLGQFTIAAHTSTDTSAGNNQILPESNINSIIDYVARTGESVVLDSNIEHSFSAEHSFSRDPYIQLTHPQSILCYPLLNQEQIVGIVYLENHATGAFTSDRIELLQLLSGQAAIAITNAQLYRALEQNVADRTAELIATQEDLMQSEKLAALGYLVAGVAHEINTPLGAIRASISNITEAARTTVFQLPQLLELLSPAAQANFFLLLDRASQNRQILSSREERQWRRAIAQELAAYEIPDVEALADTFVQMGITKTIAPFVPLLQNPHRLMIMELAIGMCSLIKDSANITIAAERASKIVCALQTYAHCDSPEQKLPTNIAESLDVILTLYSNLLKQGIELVRTYHHVPEILCYRDELNQVWTNLIHNALQAMAGDGRLEIEVGADASSDRIFVKITDSGNGIPATIQAKIFEPFFTTKPAGEGTGLGLSIVKKIIDKHLGAIAVESKPGRTTFTVTLPCST